MLRVWLVNIIEQALAELHAAEKPWGLITINGAV